MELKGKTAVVTGAGSGIGRALSIALAGKGANVVLVGHHRDSLEETATEVADMGIRSITVAADVSRLADMQRVADTATEAFGNVHLLFNNAGVGPFASISETTMEEWHWVLSVNLWGVIHGIHVFLPLFEAQGEGHINATASEAGLYGPPFLAAYNTSKFAVVGLMQSLARDLRAANSSIDTSVFCPGAVRTNLPESARKRPEAARRSVELSAETMQFGAFATELVSNGIDPAIAAACILDGINSGKFWIFSHEHVPKNALKQAEIMATEGKLTDL